MFGGLRSNKPVARQPIESPLSQRSIGKPDRYSILAIEHPLLDRSSIKTNIRPAIQKAETAIFFEMNRSMLGIDAIAAWTVVWKRSRSYINNYYK